MLTSPGSISNAKTEAGSKSSWKIINENKGVNKMFKGDSPSLHWA